MTASADIQTKTHTNVLSVPINAVTTREQTPDTTKAGKAEKAAADSLDQANKVIGTGGGLDEVVFLLQPDKTVKQVKVKTSIQDINNIEIVQGLKEGDEVITGPYGTVSKILKNGTKVKVVPKEQLFETKK